MSSITEQFKGFMALEDFSTLLLREAVLAKQQGKGRLTAMRENGLTA
jgi:hypothetical protein